MATTEDDIRKGVSVLLSQYGSLNTSEVKKLLDTVIPFDDDDKLPSPTRAEPLIIQRIGNVVSHQKETVKVYMGMYQIDKSTQPAIWTLMRGLESTETLEKLDAVEIKRKKNKRSQFVPKKIDWQGLNDTRSELGDQGEQFVMRYETNRVLQFAPNDVCRIIQLSKEQGDGAGYDILSLNDDGTERYIEVKTTKGNLDTPFYMTENEKNFFELNMNENNLFIYRVYNFGQVNKQPKIEIISAKELLSNYNFDPVSYKVTRK